LPPKSLRAYSLGSPSQQRNLSMPTSKPKEGKKKCDKCGVHTGSCVIISVKAHHMVTRVDETPQRRPLQYCDTCFPTVSYE
jgi:hypothetical protein